MVGVVIAATGKRDKIALLGRLKGLWAYATHRSLPHWS
jgi:hypothetical protein